LKVGLFGGSFDPIHRGHVEPVLAARREVELDVVYYLPTAQPPHKPRRRFAPAWRRFAMVELALIDHPELRVSTYELEHAEPAYTIDTVEHFARTMPDAELFLIIGADSYNELDQWRRWRDLLAQTRLVVLARPGSRSLRADLPRELAEPDEERVLWVDDELWDVSSTAIRETFARGETPSERELPKAVLGYCSKYELYRPSGSASGVGNR
jgi:nicotinate-nucleotide adenylyltransferase